MSGKIVSAAIRDKNKTIYEGQPGEHHQSISGRMPINLVLGAEFGFMTSEGEFVNRQDAADIAFIAGQIDKTKPQLSSDDLWPAKQIFEVE